MEMNFCRRCGTRLTHVKDHVYQCDNEHILFANCSPSVGVFVLTSDNEVLLSVRGIEPHKGMLDAFGGFVDGEEILENAAARELKEEIGLNQSDYESMRFLCSAIGHYPYRNEVLPVLSSFYWTRLKTDRQLVGMDDVASIKKIPLFDVDFAQLHDDDIREGIKTLQSFLSDR